MKLRPLGKNVLIEPKPDGREAISAGGIVLPKGEQKGVREGRVLAVAEEVTDVAPGDRVLFGKYSQQTDAGEGRVVISVDDVYAVLG